MNINVEPIQNEDGEITEHNQVPVGFIELGEGLEYESLDDFFDSHDLEDVDRGLEGGNKYYIVRSEWGNGEGYDYHKITFKS